MKHLALLLLCLLFFLTGQGQAGTDPGTVDVSAVVKDITRQGNAAMATYVPDNGPLTSDLLSDLYFDEFEGRGLETAIGLKDPALKSRLESLFSSVIGLAARNQPRAEVLKAWEQLRQELQSTAEHWAAEDQSMGFWATVIQAFLILLREGFEAMLVITALIAYLSRQGAQQQLAGIYWGMGIAVLASIATAWLLHSLFQISGATREALEGITMLVAAGVLFYVSYWLISRAESMRWQAWIQEQIDHALSRGSLFALGLAAFLAVYREGAETVLFYQALAGQSNGQWLALVTGFGTALVALFILYRLMRNASQRLPIGLFFGITAALLYYLALSFAGNGVLELQEAGWIAITPVEQVPRIPWLGLHPFRETLVAQFLLLIPLPFALAWWLRKRQAMAGREQQA